MLAGIFHHIFYLLLCVVTSIVGTVALCAIGAHFCEKGIFLYLNTPSLIIRKMPMQLVYLKSGKLLYVFLHGRHRNEMAARIEHNTAIGKTGSVFYFEEREFPCGSSTKQALVRSGRSLYLGRQKLE